MICGCGTQNVAIERPLSMFTAISTSWAGLPPVPELSCLRRLRIGVVVEFIPLNLTEYLLRPRSAVRSGTSCNLRTS